MSDLLARLRIRAAGVTGPAISLEAEAAKEIERLRAALEDIEDSPCCYDCCGGARLRAAAALEEGQADG